MMNATGNVVAGVCHPKAENANFAPAWLMYVTVQELNGCGAGCRASGGEVLDGPRTADGTQIAVIKYPAGAVLSIYGPGIERCRIQKFRMAAETPIDRLLCSTA